jgi:hypothetical protein
MSEGFCPTCGKPRTGERFCATCGNDFSKNAAETQPVATSTAPAATSAGSRGGIPRSVWLGILLVSALVIAGYVAFGNTGSQVGAGATASPTASASPTAVPTRVPTPVPTPYHGTGVISFGTAYDPDTLLITKPASTFKQTAAVAWSANFSEPAGATSVEWVISKISGATVETVVYHDEIPISDPKFDLLANKVVLGTLLTGPGKYTMRYYREAVKLAEGSFTLTK